MEFLIPTILAYLAAAAAAGDSPETPYDGLTNDALDVDDFVTEPAFEERALLQRHRAADRELRPPPQPKYFTIVALAVAAAALVFALLYNRRIKRERKVRHSWSDTLNQLMLSRCTGTVTSPPYLTSGLRQKEEQWDVGRCGS